MAKPHFRRESSNAFDGSGFKACCGSSLIEQLPNRMMVLAYIIPASQLLKISLITSISTYMPMNETSLKTLPGLLCHPRSERCCNTHGSICYGDCEGGSEIKTDSAFTFDPTEEGNSPEEDERTEDVNYSSEDDSKMPVASSPASEMANNRRWGKIF